MKLDFTKTAERWQRYGEEYLRLGIDSFFRVSERTLTTAIFVLGFALTWLQFYNFGKLSKIEISLLIVLLILGLVSIVSGIWYLLEMNRLFNRAGRTYEEKANKLFSFIMTEHITQGAAYPEVVGDAPYGDYDFNPWQFWVQLWSLAGCIVAVVALAISLVL